MSRFFGCKLSDDKIRLQSSSGGAFTALATQVLTCGGIVYGAAFSEDYRSVQHIAINKPEELPLLRGSKYIPSNLGHTFQDIKGNLSEKRPTMFTGTPCQVAALRKFLADTPQENLWCVDIICHGVPDIKIYKHYLNQLEMQYQSPVKSVNFRDKTHGWRYADFVIQFANGQEFREKVTENSFMRGFIGNLYLRLSCSQCQFKNFTSGSDITIGDFWGATEIRGYNDNMGISIVAVHSKHGQSLFDLAMEDLQNIIEVDEKIAYTFNESAYSSSNSHPRCDDFYTRFSNENFDSLIAELLPPKPVRDKQATAKRFFSSLKNLILKIYRNL